MNSKDELDQTDKETGCGLKDKTIARAIDNVRVSVKRVYFRFTDKMTIVSPE